MYIIVVFLSIKYFRRKIVDCLDLVDRLLLIEISLKVRLRRPKAKIMPCSNTKCDCNLFFYQTSLSISFIHSNLSMPNLNFETLASVDFLSLHTT